MTLEELKKLAEAATPGSWQFFVTTSREKVLRVGNHLNLIAAVAPGHHIRSDNEGGSHPSADGEYIAAVRPATVLKLLEMIAVLRQPLAEIRDRLQVTSVSHQMAVVGLARADNIERSLS